MNKILLFQPSPLGDAFFTSAIAKIIKTELPNSEIYFYTSESSKEMSLDNPFIDKFIIHTGNLIKDISNLRKYKFDYLIDTWAIGDAYYRVKLAKSKRKIFLIKKNSEKYLVPFVYTDGIKYKNNGYVFWDRLELLKPVGINPDNYIKKELPEYHISIEIQNKALETLNNLGIEKNSYFLITPKGLWKTKDIPIDLTVNLIEEINKKYNLPIILSAQPNEIQYLKEINAKSKIKAEIYTTPSIREFGALIKFSKHLISVESLPYHLAIGLKKSATVILGGYPIWKPFNYNKLNYVNIDMDCKFCASKECKIKTYDCLNSITVDMIMEKIESVINTDDL